MGTLIKRSLQIFCILLVFGLTLELVSALYTTFSGLGFQTGTSGGFVQKQKWRNLPFQIPIKDGVIRKFRGEELVLASTFSIDDLTRRVSVLPKGNPPKFLAFLGCSFTFGVGVKDGESLPSQTQLGTGKYRVYNYGVGGASPADVLHRLMNINVSDHKEKKGVFLYSMFSGHLKRYHSRMEYIGGYGLYKTFYEKRNGDWIPSGVFKERFPLRSWLARFIFFSHTYNLIRSHLSDSFSDSELEDYVGIVKRMQTESERRNGKFVLLIWPNTNQAEELVSLLKRGKIPYLDYSKLNLHLLTNGKATIPIDGHPTAETYKVLGQKIVADLDLVFPSI